jgi:uncharacterized protein YodC (DUF2158 family)
MDSMFKAGDVVFKPRHNYSMTVHDVAPSGVVCRWFEGAKLREATFSPEELMGFPQHSQVALSTELR